MPAAGPAAAGAFHAGRQASRAVSATAVHVRIRPPPRNLAESRAVLRALRRYGEVVAYKSLKWEHSGASAGTSFAVYREVGGAEGVMGESPLRVVVEGEAEGRKAKEGDVVGSMRELYGAFEAREKAASAAEGGKETDALDEAGIGDGVGARPSSPEPSGPAAGAHSRRPGTRRLTDISRTLIVHAHPWTSDFNAMLARAPYTGPFAIDTKSPAQQDLRRRVPLPGLSMVELGRAPVPARIADKRAQSLAKRPTLRSLMDGGEAASAVGVPWYGDAPDATGEDARFRRKRFFASGNQGADPQPGQRAVGAPLRRDAPP